MYINFLLLVHVSKNPLLFFSFIGYYCTVWCLIQILPNALKTLSFYPYFKRKLFQEKSFIAIICTLFLIAFLTAPLPGVARWVGFLVAGYAAVANDSIQTIGTFIASNRHRPWWMLWVFIGGIFVVTMTYSWLSYSGDVSYGRLASKGFSDTPMSFSFLQVSAPIFLLILTRLKMPVSTTFLILTAFSTSASSVAKVLSKSLTGYALAFGIAFSCLAAC